MGVLFSSTNILSSPPLSIEAEQSLNQILFALKNELELWPNRSNQDIELNTVNNIDHHRSSSFSASPRKIKQSHRLDSSPVTDLKKHEFASIKQVWLCQVCHVSNERESQLCSLCGANKINFYIPVWRHDETNHQRTMSKDTLKRRSRWIFSFEQIDSSSVRCSSFNSATNENAVSRTKYRRSVLIAHKLQVDEQIVLKHAEKLKRTCELSQTRFKDEHFPASSNSLFVNGSSFSTQTLSLLPDQQLDQLKESLSREKILWLRPDQIHAESWPENHRTSWTVFRDPTPNDVLQGSLGDCWFITALSVLAEEPQHLMKVRFDLVNTIPAWFDISSQILLTKEYNRQGIYCVRLCKGNRMCVYYSIESN